MHGNVWEWCRDAYRSNYEALKSDNPLNDQGLSRVVRGGSWIYSSTACRAASRIDIVPDNWSTYIGFRCMLLLP